MLNNMDLTDKQLGTLYKTTIGNDDKAFKDYKGKTKSYLKFKIDADKEKIKRTGKATGSSSNADKINAIQKGKYSNKEMMNLYDTFVSDSDEVYKALKKTNINMKEYLKYKEANLSADKYDDGTVNGKTISGSAKAKKVEFINNMNITYEQKLLLLGSSNKLSNQERTILANYVNSLNMSRQDKLDLYGKLKGFTVYKDGRVTW